MDWLWFVACLINFMGEERLDPDAEVTAEELQAAFANARVRYVIESFQKDIDEGRI